MDIYGSGSLTAAMLYKWVQARNPDDPIRIDLSEATFIDVAGLAMVVALAEHASIFQIPLDFRAPRGDALTYASRMHLRKCLQEVGVDADIPPVRERPAHDRLFELHHFDPTGYEDLAEAVMTAFLGWGGPHEDAENLWGCLSELLENVVSHSGVLGGWAAMQVQPRGDWSDITFVVADSGRGLRSSLEESYVVESDARAIELAFERGVSRTGKPTRGQGLYDFLERVHGVDGQVRAISSTAAGASLRRGGIHQRTLNAAYPGTMVYASLRMSDGGRS